MVTSVDVFEALRKDIILGKYEPMHFFDPRQLSNKHLTSVAPIREAMLRLSERGLLRWERNRGFFVEKLTSLAALFYLEQLRTAYLFAVKRIKETKNDLKISKSAGTWFNGNNIGDYIEWHRGLSDTIFTEPEREFVNTIWDKLWIYRNKYLKDGDIMYNLSNLLYEAIILLANNRCDECFKQIEKIFKGKKEIIIGILPKIDA